MPGDAIPASLRDGYAVGRMARRPSRLPPVQGRCPQERKRDMGKESAHLRRCLVRAKTLPNSAYGAWGAPELGRHRTMPRDDRNAVDRYQWLKSRAARPRPDRSRSTEMRRSGRRGARTARPDGSGRGDGRPTAKRIGRIAGRHGGHVAVRSTFARVIHHHRRGRGRRHGPHSGLSRGAGREACSD